MSEWNSKCNKRSVCKTKKICGWIRWRSLLFLRVMLMQWNSHLKGKTSTSSNRESLKEVMQDYSKISPWIGLSSNLKLFFQPLHFHALWGVWVKHKFDMDLENPWLVLMEIWKWTILWAKTYRDKVAYASLSIYIFRLPGQFNEIFSDTLSHGISFFSFSVSPA